MDQASANRDGLSPREQQLISLAAEGLTDAGICHRLGISEGTVNTYWSRIRAKIGQYNRVELVARVLRDDAEKAVRELREENEALKDRIEPGSHAAEQWRAVLERAADAILLVDPAGRISFANEAAQHLFGFTEDEMLGLSIQALVPDRYHETHRRQMDAYRINPMARKMGDHTATYARRKGDSEFLVAASLAGVELDGETWIICTVRAVASGRRVADG